MRFSPGCCCGKPIIAISTIDSSVEYAFLCVYEDSQGRFPPGIGGNGPPACPFPQPPPANQPADGSCVSPPLQKDRDKYNADRQKLSDSLNEFGGSFPLAAAEIVGRYRCWSGIKGAVIPTGEPDPQDSYGNIEIVISGSSYQARITLQDLKDTFIRLYDKHFPPANEPGGQRDQSHEAIFLFDVDNSGSITVAGWPSQVKTDFTTWLTQQFPNVTRKETTITNYLVDTEAWVNRLNNNYLKEANP